MGWEPPADTYDLWTGGKGDGGLGLPVWVWCIPGDVDGGVAVDAIAKVGREGSGVAVEIHLSYYYLYIAIFMGNLTLPLNTHLKYGSSAKAFWMHATAAGMSAGVIGRTSIAILNK